jgi:hypothetical protein
MAPQALLHHPTENSNIEARAGIQPGQLEQPDRQQSRQQAGGNAGIRCILIAQAVFLSTWVPRPTCSSALSITTSCLPKARGAGTEPIGCLYWTTHTWCLAIAGMSLILCSTISCAGSTTAAMALEPVPW